MSIERTLELVQQSRLVAIVRSRAYDQLLPVAKVLLESGVNIIEFPLAGPRTIESIHEVRSKLPSSVVIGAGTVLESRSAFSAIDAGAAFIVSPITDEDTIRVCRRHGCVSMPGAFTPTEIYSAFMSGADVVKVFPADAVGTAYLRSVAVPLPDIRLMPTGGVTPERATEYLKAGAFCIGVGSELVNSALIEREDFVEIGRRADAFVAAVRPYSAESGNDVLARSFGVRGSRR